MVIVIDMVQAVKNPPTMWETRLQSLGQEDPLEKGMPAHTSTLAWRIPWTEESGGLQPMGSESQTRLSNYHFQHFSKAVLSIK